MYSLEQFDINLEDLEEGLTEFRFHLDKDYFEAVGGHEIHAGDIETVLSVRRTGASFSLKFDMKGTVIQPCDVCLDDVELPLSAEGELKVRLGEENSEDEDMIIVNKDDCHLDVSWYIYEFVALNIPIKHVHAPGKCNPAMIKALQEHSAARSSDGDEESAIDPRWSELEKLKTIIKD
ncbi:MAG: YceD family protein [Prevotella sp.]